MNFELRNFGKIYEADVKLDGITVICGDNNTGKSTVGKALFSFYNSLYDYKARIKDRIDEKLTSYLLDYISKKSDILIDNLSTQTIDEVREIIKKMQENNNKVTENKNYILLENDVLSELVYRYFDMIMNGEVKRKKTTEKDCVVKAEFKGRIVNELRFTDRKWSCNIEEPVAHKAYYINSPYVLDYLNNRLIDISSMSILERNAIEAIKQAEEELNADSMANILDAVNNKKDLEEVREVLKKAYKGETCIVNGLYVYEEDGMQIDFRNISAGLKAFAIIERLLESGVLKKKDVLILDEPEIHLHSEWQIYYAELIVALQKKFDLTILLVTHSFQFLESLNFFMKKYEISDRGNYYIPEETNNGYVMRSDNENLKKIKHNLSTGTFHIADLEFEYDMEHDNG